MYLACIRGSIFCHVSHLIVPLLREKHPRRENALSAVSSLNLLRPACPVSSGQKAGSISTARLIAKHSS
jgi:hypothetical protein